VCMCVFRGGVAREGRNSRARTYMHARTNTHTTCTRAQIHTQAYTHRTERDRTERESRTKAGETATKMPPPPLPVILCNHSVSPPSVPPPPPLPLLPPTSFWNTPPRSVSARWCASSVLWGSGVSNQATAAANSGIPVHDYTHVNHSQIMYRTYTDYIDIYRLYTDYIEIKIFHGCCHERLSFCRACVRACLLRACVRASVS
jgi:hypothetical protein